MLQDGICQVTKTFFSKTIQFYDINYQPVSYTHLMCIRDSNDLAASFEGRNEYISRLCSYPLLILDDFGMELSLIHI